MNKNQRIAAAPAVLADGTITEISAYELSEYYRYPVNSQISLFLNNSVEQIPETNIDVLKREIFSQEFYKGKLVFTSVFFSEAFKWCPVLEERQKHLSKFVNDNAGWFFSYGTRKIYER
jgi:hypothetical protein